jgi:cohesin loading factor subunit SCC2
VQSGNNRKIVLQNKITQHQISHLQNQWEKRKTNKSDENDTVLSPYASMKLLQTVNAQTDVLETFPRLLGTILRLMGDPLVALRKPAVKALNQIISADPRMMFHRVVKKAVAKCFVDDAISVREAAVTLVGNYVLQSPKVAYTYHEALLNRLEDTGVSVRKAVVKIFRDVLLTQPLYPQRTETCCALVGRFNDPKEEEAIRDSIYDIFMNLWFSKSSSKKIMATTTTAADSDSDEKTPNKKNGTTSSSMITPNATGSSAPAAFRNEFCASALQIIDVVSKMKDTSFLANLVRNLLFSLGEGEKISKLAQRKKRRVEAERTCSQIVAQCAEELVCWDEEGEGREGRKSLIGIVSTLNVFAEAAPNLLLPHLDTILPYLKTDSNDNINQTICTHLCNILSCTASIMSNVTIKQIATSDVVEDLLLMVLRCGPEGVSASVKALSFLGAHVGLGQPRNIIKVKLFKKSREFYSYLMRTKAVTDDHSKLKGAVRNNIMRALQMLGSVCKYNTDMFTGSDIALVSSSPMEAEDLRYANLSINAFNLFRIFLDKVDDPTKTSSLRAMSGVFIGTPKLFLQAEQLGLIDEVMGPTSSAAMQRQALECWCEVLLYQEKRVEELNLKAAAKMNNKSEGNGGVGSPNKSISQKVSGDQDSDACLAGGVLTCKADAFYGFCMSTDIGIRRATVKLIGRMLRQGLINPNDAIPNLLALQGDVGSGGVREEALRLLGIEAEKRPEMLRQRVRMGIERGMKLQNRLGKSFSPVLRMPGGGVESVFGRVYVDNIRSDKMLRQNLFKSLLGVFVDGEDEASDFVLNYVGATLAHLPFLNLNEVLNIIYQGSGIVAVDGNAVVDSLKKVVKAMGVEGEDEDGDDCGEMGWEEIGTLFALDWKGMEEPLEKLKGLLRKADAIVVLLRLKFFLKKVYGIADNKIDEYTPMEKGRQTPLSQPDAMPVFDVLSATKDYKGPLKRRGGNKYSTGDEEVDELIWKLANFRRLMCQYEGDFELTKAATVVVQKATAEEGKVVAEKKKPKGKKKKKKKVEEEDDDEMLEEFEDEEEQGMADRGLTEDDFNDIDLDEDDFDDDEPLFMKLQKKAAAEAKAAAAKSKSGGKKGSTGKKRRVAAVKVGDDDDDFVTPKVTKRRRRSVR